MLKNEKDIRKRINRIFYYDNPFTGFLSITVSNILYNLPYQISKIIVLRISNQFSTFTENVVKIKQIINYRSCKRHEKEKHFIGLKLYHNYS